MANANVLIDNDKVKVTEWSFEVGDSTGHHIHEYNYIIVPMLDGELKIIDNNLSNNEDYFINNHPHQVYIEFLAEHGIVGTIILLSIIFTLIFKNLKIIIFGFIFLIFK